VRQRFAALDPVQLLRRDRPPEPVDYFGRAPRHGLLVPLEMLPPQPQARRARQVGVVGDDVHLRVVHERVRVQVRGADGEPAVVDDADLRMHIDDVAQRAFTGVDGAGEEAVVAVVRVDERRDLPPGDVGPVVRPGRQQHDDPEVVARRRVELLHEHVDDLGRPEELVLEVDEVLRRP